MLVTNFRITNYKSITDSKDVELGRSTVLVGRNESGKTAILEALHKARSVDGTSYEYVADYPRKGLAEYEGRHAKEPALVAEISYELESEDIEAANEFLGTDLIDFLKFSCLHFIDNSVEVQTSLPEQKFVEFLRDGFALPAEEQNVLDGASTLRELFDLLKEMDLNEEGRARASELVERFGGDEETGSLGALLYQKVLLSRIPKFVYFDEYAMLPAKVNVDALRQKRQKKGLLEEGDKTILGLLELANVELDSLTQASGYEPAKARLEGISNKITDEIFELWTQNQSGERQELEVQFDLKEDLNDVPPFNKGANLYVRIRGLRHRVSVPFDKRSRGFKWFFSFVVWFENVKQRVGVEESVVLLLDEPGLSLHALAQRDLLRYFDRLSGEHQIVFSTHSPFMVRTERLSEVRLVEDLPKSGTTVFAELSSGDSRTLFPLQAALGYSVAQSLFLTSKNLLVEGVSDFVYLQCLSSALQAEGREGLRDDVVVVPVGGMDKIATFVALLSGNDLAFVVLHDWAKGPDQRLLSLVRERIVHQRSVLNYAMFLDAGSGDVSHADVEDLFDEEFFVSLFSKTFSRELGREIDGADLPSGRRVVERLTRFLSDAGLSVRESPGFNHYRPAAYLASNPSMLGGLSAATLDRFERLFKRVNSQFG